MTTEQIISEAEDRYTKWDNLFMCSRRAFQAGAEWMQEQQWVEVSPDNIPPVYEAHPGKSYSAYHILTDGIFWDRGYYDFQIESWITTIKKPTHYQKIILPKI